MEHKGASFNLATFLIANYRLSAGANPSMVSENYCDNSTERCFAINGCGKTCPPTHEQNTLFLVSADFRPVGVFMGSFLVRRQHSWVVSGASCFVSA